MSLPTPQLTADAVHAGLSLLDAAILGVVEGITEYLPISSTGHLIIASGLLGLNEPAELKSAVDAFNIVIQGGAILAVLGLYRQRVGQMIKGLVGKDPAGLKLTLNLFVAFLPAAVLGVLLADAIEARLFNTPVVLAMLVIGGVYMIALDVFLVAPKRREDAELDERGEEHPRGTIEEMTWRGSLVVGFLQCVAMVPGTSRSMMTITGGVIVGLRPRAAAEFSFLLGLPTLGGACVYSLAKNLKRSADAGEPNMFEVLGVGPILVGLVVATLSAALAVKWLVGFLNTHGLAGFGYYRILLAAVLGALLFTNTISLA